MVIYLGIFLFLLHIIGSFILIMLNGFLKEWVKFFVDKKIIFVFFNLVLFSFSIPVILVISCVPLLIYVKYPFLKIDGEYIWCFVVYGSLVGVAIIESPLYKTFDKKIKDKFDRKNNRT